MSNRTTREILTELRQRMSRLKHWGWLLLANVILIVVGIAALDFIEKRMEMPIGSSISAPNRGGIWVIECWQQAINRKEKASCHRAVG